MEKEKVKKPFYKKWWVWLIAIIIIFSIGSAGGKDDKNLDTKEKVNKEVTENKVADDAKEDKEDVPREYKSALKKAKVYANTMYMSKAGIYDQLISEHGESFSEEAAQYAIDNVEADWNENALKKATTYQDQMAMSPNAIYDQLISEHGEKFTEEEAQYAIDNLPK